MTRDEVLAYEIHSSWWTRHLSHPVLQNMAGTYFAWKVRRKWGRWIASLEERASLAGPASGCGEK